MGKQNEKNNQPKILYLSLFELVSSNFLKKYIAMKYGTSEVIMLTNAIPAIAPPAI